MTPSGNCHKQLNERHLSASKQITVVVGQTDKWQSFSYETLSEVGHRASRHICRWEVFIYGNVHYLENCCAKYGQLKVNIIKNK